MQSFYAYVVPYIQYSTYSTVHCTVLLQYELNPPLIVKDWKIEWTENSGMQESTEIAIKYLSRFFKALGENGRKIFSETLGLSQDLPTTANSLRLMRHTDDTLIGPLHRLIKTVRPLLHLLLWLLLLPLLLLLLG